jgi:hypothetical protein
VSHTPVVVLRNGCGRSRCAKNRALA